MYISQTAGPFCFWGICVRTLCWGALYKFSECIRRTFTCMSVNHIVWTQLLADLNLSRFLLSAWLVGKPHKWLIVPTWEVIPAGSNGRCNTAQCFDSRMLPRAEPSIWPQSIKA